MEEKAKNQKLEKQDLHDIAGGRETYVIWECGDCTYRWESLKWETECPDCRSSNIKSVGTHVHW